MTARTIGMLGLHIQLALVRFGWVRAVVCVICIAGTVGWAWGIPLLQAQSTVQQQNLDRMLEAARIAQIAPPAIKRSAAEERLSNFHDVLGEKLYVEQQIKSLFAIAKQSGLTLNQGEYKFAFDKNGDFYTYQILLPVKGPYRAIRQFCEQTLQIMPFASLDEMNFKRDAIGSRTLEVKLRFTLYLSDSVVPVKTNLLTVTQEVLQ